MVSQKYGSSRPRWSWVLIILVCYAPGVVRWQNASADEPAVSIETNVEIEMLIDQLSGSSFAVRETASKRLLEIGAPSLAMLRKAQQHPAIEVRERASRICEEIDQVVFESVTRKFILAADGAQSFGLPAWDAFRSITGDSRTSKLLFVTMLRSQRELATFVEAASTAKGAPNAAAAFEALASKTTTEAIRLRLRSNRGELPDVGDTVGLLVACSMFGDNSLIASGANEVNEEIVISLHRVPQAEYFTKAGYGRCMRALAGQWISKTQAALAVEVLDIAMKRGIPEGAIVARRHLDATTAQETRVQALQCLARFGNEADIEFVSKLLHDESIVYEFRDQGEIGLPRDDIREEDMPPPGLQRQILPMDNRRMIVRLNDLALAVCMVLGSEDLTRTFPKYKPNEAKGILLVECAFPTDGQEYHKLAIARWRRDHPQFVEKAN